MKETIEELQAEWERLEAVRQSLPERHDPDSGLFYQDEPWFEEYLEVEDSQAFLRVVIGAYELLGEAAASS